MTYLSRALSRLRKERTAPATEDWTLRKIAEGGGGGGGGATDLGYTAATRLLTSSTGTDVTLPLVASGAAGLAPASGGGTTNFLRADGTWAAPAGGGGSSPALAWVI